MADCTNKKAVRKTSRGAEPGRAIVWLAAVLAMTFTACAPIRADAVPDAFGYLRIDVEDISYLGDDRYKMELSVLNRSDTDVKITEIGNDFFLQTEVIGGWASLENRMNEGFRDGTIPSGGSKGYSLVLMMPLDIPMLYINAFGEVNLKFVYRAGVSTVEGDKVYERRDERFYWITPRTGKWVLREGM